jgi:hypothetical protein
MERISPWHSLRYIPCIYLQQLRKTMTNPSQKNWSLGSYFNPGPPGYEYYHWLWHSIWISQEDTDLLLLGIFTIMYPKFLLRNMGEGLNYVMKYRNNNYLLDFMFKMYNMQMYISPGRYVQLTQLQYTQTFRKLKRNKMCIHNFKCYFMRYFVSIYAGCVTCGSPWLGGYMTGGQNN